MRPPLQCVRFRYDHKYKLRRVTNTYSRLSPVNARRGLVRAPAANPSSQLARSRSHALRMAHPLPIPRHAGAVS